MPNKSSRERLLDAAYRIVSEESLSDLSIDHVSERAGLSRRTFFLHFTSKDQLIAEMLDHVRPAYATRYRQWTEDLDPGLPPERRILAMCRRLVAETNAPEWRGSCFVRISAEFGERRGHPVHAAAAGAHDDMQGWLEAELSRGKFVAPATLARHLMIIINGLIITQLVHRDASYGDDALGMIATLLAAARGIS